MDPAGRKQFISSYTKVLTTAWTNEQYASRLQSEPKVVLAEAGLEVPESATLQILTESGGDPNIDQAVDLWEEGSTSGTYKLYVPPEPQYETGELDEADLEAVVGGGTSACCCCSSPCCCCT